MAAIKSKNKNKDKGNTKTEIARISRRNRTKFIRCLTSTNHILWRIKGPTITICLINNQLVTNPSQFKVITNMNRYNNSSIICLSRFNNNSKIVFNFLLQVFNNTHKWDTKTMKVHNKDNIMVEIAFNRKALIKEVVLLSTKTCPLLAMLCQMTNPNN